MRMGHPLYLTGVSFISINSLINYCGDGPVQILLKAMPSVYGANLEFNVLDRFIFQGGIDFFYYVLF